MRDMPSIFYDLQLGLPSVPEMVMGTPGNPINVYKTAEDEYVRLNPKGDELYWHASQSEKARMRRALQLGLVAATPLDETSALPPEIANLSIGDDGYEFRPSSARFPGDEVAPSQYDFFALRTSHHRDYIRLFNHRPQNFGMVAHILGQKSVILCDMKFTHQLRASAKSPRHPPTSQAH